MKLLKGIGNLFVKLWRWIKETAWVQPLLIVGAIFAIIFSIPYFTKWVDSLSNKTTNAYFSQYQISLNKSNVGDQSKADKFTSALNYYSYFNENKTLAEAKTDTGYSAISFNNFTSTYGEKFYLVYVSESCGDCKEFQPALELLDEQWGVQYFDNSATKTDIKIHTIFADEDSDIDDDPVNEYVNKTIFERYLDDHVSFFENSCSRLENKQITPYTHNASISTDKFKNYSLENGNSSFPVPTVLLVDFTAEAFAAHRQGVSDVLFGVSGNTEYAKATLLSDMWNHFENNELNKFSASYNAK